MTITEQLEAELAEARRAEAAEIQAEVERRDAALLAYARKRLDAYDDQQLQADVTAARRRLVEAVANDPVWSALVEWKAAQWRRHRAGHAAALDHNALAVAEGEPASAVYDAPAPGPINLRELDSLIEFGLLDRMEAEREAEQNAYVEAAASTLTAEQIQLLEQERDLERRRAEVVQHSIDVTGMSDAQRQAALLDKGTTHDPHGPGGFRKVIGQ
jgi:hypothetical protein